MRACPRTRRSSRSAGTRRQRACARRAHAVEAVGVCASTTSSQQLFLLFPNPHDALQQAPAAAAAPAPRQQRQCALRCRAQAPGGGDSSGGSSSGSANSSGGGSGGGRGATDWDRAWARYQRARGGAPGSGGLPPRAAATRTIAPDSAGLDPAARQVKDEIRRQESLLLNLWTTPAFQGGMAAVALVVLIAFVAAAGPPPVDDRCTLPWC